MQVKFVEVLNENGIDVSTTTTKIKELKKEFDSAWQDYQGLYESYEIAEDSEKEALAEEIAEFEKDLEEADDMLVKKINDWMKNKDVWAENTRKLAEGRANKKAAKENAVQSAPAQPQVVIPSSGTIPTQGATTVSASGGLVEEKESSNSGWWLLAGFIGIVTLGAVIMKRE
jgi:hypothetical protein